MKNYREIIAETTSTCNTLNVAVEEIDRLTKNFLTEIGKRDAVIQLLEERVSELEEVQSND